MAVARRDVLVQLDDVLVHQLDEPAFRLGSNRSELLRPGAQAVLLGRPRPARRRRPVCVLTRDAAIAVVTAVTCAPTARTRRIRSEVEIERANLDQALRDAIDLSPTGR